VTQANASVTAASPCSPATFRIWYNVPHERLLVECRQDEEAIASAAGGEAIRNVIVF